MRTVHFRSILSALALTLALPLVAQAQVGIGLSVTVAPPEIPVYEQPEIPGDGYIWTPGFWQWGDAGYYWVPGTWVQPPTVGVLWTPGYWGWGEGVYLFHPGYWGPHVGFYGGVNYGYGYGGAGFEGGYWRGGRMYYNRSVMNVGSVHITNVYNKTVIVNNSTRVSFNGGNGGVRAAPTRAELAAVHDRHIQPTRMQTEHVHAAASDRELRASVNHGAPAIAATEKPGVFTGRGVVRANAAPASAPVRTDRPPTAMHGEMHTPGAQNAPSNQAPVMHAGPHPEGAAMAPRPSASMTPRAPARAPAMTQHVAPVVHTNPAPAPHPSAAPAPPPRPAAAVAPPHPPVQHAQQPHGAPAAPQGQGRPQGHDEKHDQR